MTDFFIPHSDIEHASALGFFVSDPMATDRQAELQAAMALDNATADETGKLDAKTRTCLGTLRFATLMRDPMPDVIGAIDTSLLELAVSEPLKTALAPLVGGAVEFIPVPNMWNKTDNTAWTGAPYYFLNVRLRLDGWDRDKTQIYIHDQQPNGETPQSLTGRATVKRAAVGDALIWRDAHTRTLVIAKRIKDLLDQFRTEALFYARVATSEPGAD